MPGKRDERKCDVYGDCIRLAKKKKEKKMKEKKKKGKRKNWRKNL